MYYYFNVYNFFLSPFKYTIILLTNFVVINKYEGSLTEGFVGKCGYK